MWTDLWDVVIAKGYNLYFLFVSQSKGYGFITCQLFETDDSHESEVIVYIDLYIECTKKAINGGPW